MDLPMRLQIVSDLHLEFGDYQRPRPLGDVVVLAGDIHQGAAGLHWAKRAFRNTPVIYVLGNHEFYGHSIPDLIKTVKREAKGSHVHVLENNMFKLGGFVFLGCTLWTDFGLLGHTQSAMETADLDLNDFALIRKDGFSSRFRPWDSARIHARSVRWLKTQLSRQDPRQTVVVTHHAPSPQSILAEQSGNLLTAAFASDLNRLIKASGIRLWIHGHTHHNVGYKIGRTKVYSNQRGYPGDISRGFELEAVIEL